MPRDRRYTFAFVFASILAISTLLLAQNPTAALLRGVITDTSGGVLPGVLVKIVGPAPSIAERSVTTDERGEYRLVDLLPGTYRLSATLSGFQLVEMPLTVEAGAERSLPITMKLGAVTEKVTVAGAALAVDVQSAARLTYMSTHGQASATNVVMVDGMSVNGLSAQESGNTEAYDRIDENKWQKVSNRPLSTFSIDVDTASYANVRRFLTNGQLPPKDAVRVEELINYFSYDYAEPRDGKPFAVTTELGECPWDVRHRLALIGLQAKRFNSDDTPPRNLVFLIDVSGSMMSPNKLPLVKASLSMFARNLTPRDRIAIVVYAGASGLALPTTAGSDTATVLAAIGRLEAGGSTNGAAGLRLAYKTAREQFIPQGANRVILATDGDFNVGVTNQGDLIRLIEEQRESGVFLSVLGYGMGNLKDSTMEKLADHGNGNYAYIDSLQEARKVLVHEAGGTLVTVAKDVKLQVEFNPRLVSSYRLVGYENRVLQDQDFNDDRKDAGDIGAGHSVTALYEIVPAGQTVDLPEVDPLKYQRRAQPAASSASDELMTVKLRYKAPDGDTSSLTSTTITANTTSSASLGFAAAVAEFGMVLRDSAFKGRSSYPSAFVRATRHKGNDPFGHRGEFITLIGKAEELARTNR